MVKRNRQFDLNMAVFAKAHGKVGVIQWFPWFIIINFV